METYEYLTKRYKKVQRTISRVLLVNKDVEKVYHSDINRKRTNKLLVSFTTPGVFRFAYPKDNVEDVIGVSGEKDEPISKIIDRAVYTYLSLCYPDSIQVVKEVCNFEQGKLRTWN